MSRREILVRVRLLSSSRQAKHGAIPEDAGVWWQQIEALAIELGVPMTYAEWMSVSRRQDIEP